jgi:hypothetical protein
LWSCSALLIVSAVLFAGCDWSMFRYGAAHTGSNTTETSIGVGNVANLRTRFVAPGGSMEADGSATVANGVAYVGVTGSAFGRYGLSAFSADGTAGCAGTPKTCAPLWSAYPNEPFLNNATPAVANGVVYFSVSGKYDNRLFAYDADGTTGCSGTPKICSPLWSATLHAMTGVMAPTVVNGIVYISDFGDFTSDPGDLYAFDANGVTGCSGMPKICSPLWIGLDGGTWNGSPAVVNGTVYVGGKNGTLSAYDANGVSGCSGIPKTCSPRWTGHATGGDFGQGSPAVANGLVYYDGAAFDAKGATGCSGAPKSCTPLWRFGNGSAGYGSSPAVANGVLFVGGGPTNELRAFDALGKTGCGGIPKTCAPLWTASTDGDVRTSPAVANGVVYIAVTDPSTGTIAHHGFVYAFDGSGTSGCSGTPKRCTPLWRATTLGAITASPAIANGLLYIGSAGGLYVFGLP